MLIIKHQNHFSQMARDPFSLQLGLLFLRFLVHTNDIGLCCSLIYCSESLEGFRVKLWDQSHVHVRQEFLVAPIHPLWSPHRSYT
jgi:hypothetical protein